MNSRGRGIAIGTVLLAVALVAVLGFALVSLSITHLSLLARTSNDQQARDLARSAVEQAMAALCDDKSFGTAASSAPSDLTIRLTDCPGTGRLTFSQQTAAKWSIPVSVNNIHGSGSVEGGGDQVVPTAAAYLVGVGRCGGVQRTVEAMVAIPPFPFAIASGGPVRSEGGVLIAGLPPGTQPTLDLTKLSPADLLTNFAGSECVRLGADTTVTGDIRAAGEVVLDDPSVKVLGEIDSRVTPEPIPSLDPERYDPQAENISYDKMNSVPTTDGPVQLTGAVRSNDSLVFPSGLSLNGATLYVDGNLTVEGGLKGTGLVVVNGTTTISGGTELTSENQVALLSQGQITLSGTGPETSCFEGLLYSNAGLQAQQIAVVGTLVTQGQQGVSLDHVYVYEEKTAGTTSASSTTVTSTSGTSTGGSSTSGNATSRSVTLALFRQGPTRQTPDTYYLTLQSDPGGKFTLLAIPPTQAQTPITVTTFQQLPSEGGLSAALNAWIKTTVGAGPNQYPGVTTTTPPSGAIMARLCPPAAFNSEASGNDSAVTAAVSRLLGLASPSPSPSSSPSPPPPPGITYVNGKGLVTVQPSEFLKELQNIRLALWREK